MVDEIGSLLIGIVIYVLKILQYRKIYNRRVCGCVWVYATIATIATILTCLRPLVVMRCPTVVTMMTLVTVVIVVMAPCRRKFARTKIIYTPLPSTCISIIIYYVLCNYH